MNNSNCHQGTFSGGRHARPAHRRHRREPEVHELPLRLQQDRSGTRGLRFPFFGYVNKRDWMFGAKLTISARKENFASVLDLPRGGGQAGEAAAQRRHQL